MKLKKQNHYQNQKSEFHFNQKNDSDFLMFLLDTAVRVISIGIFICMKQLQEKNFQYPMKVNQLKIEL